MNLVHVPGGIDSRTPGVFPFVTCFSVPLTRLRLMGGAVRDDSLSDPLEVWISISFRRWMPGEIVEAARIDGCKWHQVFFRITMPLARGGIATATIFISIFAWNELLLPLFLTNRVAKTFPVLLTAFQGQTEIACELMCAGATIQVLPILILTFFVQKHIIAGLTLVSSK